jgi:hypothetical protein
MGKEEVRSPKRKRARNAEGGSHIAEVKPESVQKEDVRITEAKLHD